MKIWKGFNHFKNGDASDRFSVTFFHNFLQKAKSEILPTFP